MVFLAGFGSYSAIEANAHNQVSSGSESQADQDFYGYSSELTRVPDDAPEAKIPSDLLSRLNPLNHEQENI